MKRIKWLILVIAMVFMLPTVVKADTAPIAFDGYSNETAVGAEIEFVMKGYERFDGKITYNKDELTFVKEGVYDPDFVEGSVGPMGDIVFTQKNDGELSFYFKQAEGVSTSSVKELRFTFKVKAATTNEIKIVYTPKDPSVLYGSASYTRTYTVLGDKTKCIEAVENSEDKEGTSSEPTETIPEKTTTTVETKKDNTLLYVSCGLNGLLLVCVIALILKKRQ